MKKRETSPKSKKKYKSLNSPDFTSPDVNSDKTGKDNDADKTVKRVGQRNASHEFDLYVLGRFIGGISTSPWTNKTLRGSA